MSESAPKQASWVGQLSLILTLTAAVIIALRLLVIATWSRRTALAILQTAGSAQVITGVLVSTIGTAGGAAVGLYLVVRGFFLAAGRRRPRAVDWIVILVAAVLELIVVPLYLVPITFAVLIGAIGVGFWRGREPLVRARYQSMKTHVARLLAITGMGLAALVIVLIDNRPWLPPENVTLASNAHVQTGYVLHLDEHDLTLLIGNRPREVVHIIDPQVVRREICGGVSIWWDVAPLKNILGAGLILNALDLTEPATRSRPNRHSWRQNGPRHTTLRTLALTCALRVQFGCSTLGVGCARTAQRPGRMVSSPRVSPPGTVMVCGLCADLANRLSQSLVTAIPRYVPPTPS